MSEASRRAGRQAGRQYWPGKCKARLLCSALAAVEDTHGSEQMAVYEGDGLTDENCWGYPAREFSQAETEREGETEANLT